MQSRETCSVFIVVHRVRKCGHLCNIVNEQICRDKVTQNMKQGAKRLKKKVKYGFKLQVI